MKNNQIRFKFTKTGEFKYLSHLDITRFIIRAMERAQINLEYSQGFNPKPRLSFSHPTPLGVESVAEYGDAALSERMDPEDFKIKLNSQLKPQLEVQQSKAITRKIGSLMADIGIVLYRFQLKLPESGCSLEEILNNDIQDVDDIGKTLYELAIEPVHDNLYLLNLYGYVKIFKKKNNAIFKYNYFYDYFTGIAEKYNVNIYSVVKQEMFIADEGKLLLPMEVI
ncbi:MAG: TIGR03936 family radical SAM-associated protein [Actinomycetia bacterium]|nr:TIGR03936 family radical SAM-associated protein [Actinomycetes bacterium]